MTTFADIWSSLQRPGKPLPFLLIDCAGIEGGASRIPRHIFSDFECLFAGDLATELMDVAPYLGRLKSFSAEVSKMVEDLLARQVGTLIEPMARASNPADLTFAQLHRHFRKFNVVDAPNGKKLFFRYYDPRIMMDVLSVLDAHQTKEFLSPMDAISLTNQHRQTIRYLCAGGTLPAFHRAAI